MYENEAVRESTGIFVELYEGDYVVRKEATEARQRQKNGLHEKQEREKRRAEGGTFTWGDMDELNRLTAEVDATQLGYLFVLQTFIDYDTNVLVIGRNKRPMTKDDIQKTLNVGRKALWEFLRTMVLYSVIFEDSEGRYILNDAYIFRGELGKRTPHVIRTYDMVARNVYEVVRSARKVKQLGYLFKTLPYIHMYNNVICANPFETDATKIIPFDKGQIAELLGVDEKTAYRIIRSMQFGEEVVFAEMIRGLHRYYMVNPNICARGEVGPGLRTLFKVVNQSWYRKKAAEQAQKKAAKESE